MQRYLGPVLALAVTATPSLAADITPMNVAFDDYGAVTAPLTATAGDPAQGAKVFANRKLGNCLACHENADMSDAPFHGEVGPPLDGVGSRWEAAELRGIVSNAKMTFPDTIMPAFYIDAGYERPLDKFAGKSILSSQDVEDLVAYLLTLTDE